MVACHLDELRSRADLIVVLWFDVTDFLSVIKLVANLLKIVFHKVDVALIVSKVDSWVSNQQNTELVEALCDLLTLNFDIIREAAVRPVLCIQIEFHIDHRDVLEVITGDVLI